MKRILLALCFLSPLALAQTPDCPAQTFTLTADGSVGGSSGYYKNIPTGCTLWYVSYQATSGITGFTLAFQRALGTVAPGSFSTVTPTSTSPSYGTAIDGMATYNAVTSTSGTNLLLPFVRVNVSGSSGVGSIQIQMWGYRAGYSAKGSGGSGGGGTVTNVAGGCSLAGGPITTTGTLSQSEPVNVQTGTSYTFLSSDCGKLVSQSNAGAIADTLPAASVLGLGYYFDVQDTGTGTITLTPTTSTIDGASSLTIATNQGVRIASNGTNYFTQRGLGATSSGGVTSVASGCSLAGGTITTTGTLSQATPINSQVGTSYTFLSTDCGKLVSQSNAAAIADTLPVATTSGFGTGFFVKVENTGVGAVTITPTTSTIDGAATLVLSQNQGVEIASNGTNYFTMRGIGSGTGTPTSPIIPCPHNALCQGIYLLDNNANAYGPIYPVKIPPVAASWTRAGNSTASLTDIVGGGLTFGTPKAQTPGGWSLALLSTTSWTFTVQMPSLVSTNAGVIGIFCADNAGNGALFHWGTGAGIGATSVSRWTGMQSAGTPLFIGLLGNAVAATSVPQFLQIQVVAGSRNYNYSTDGQTWTQYSNEGSTNFTTCTRAGIEGYGDATNYGSLGTVVSVFNTTP